MIPAGYTLDANGKVVPDPQWGAPPPPPPPPPQPQLPPDVQEFIDESKALFDQLLNTPIPDLNPNPDQSDNGNDFQGPANQNALYATIAATVPDPTMTVADSPAAYAEVSEEDSGDAGTGGTGDTGTGDTGTGDTGTGDTGTGDTGTGGTGDTGTGDTGTGDTGTGDTGTGDTGTGDTGTGDTGTGDSGTGGTGDGSD